MSSTYDWICLGHDPALTFGRDLSLADLERRPDSAEHVDCDLLIGRWSGGLVQIGCPARSNHPGSWHRDVNWLDVDYLRVLYQAARAPKNDDLAHALAPVLGRCWSWHRLNRLRVLLSDPA